MRSTPLLFGHIRDAQPREKFLEARHRAEVIDTRINSQPQHRWIEVVDCFFKEIKGAISIAESQFNVREVFGGDALVVGGHGPLELSQMSLRFGAPAGEYPRAE